MENKMLLYYIAPSLLHASVFTKWANNKTGEIVFRTEQPSKMEFLGCNADFTVEEPQNNEIVCSGIVAYVTYYLRRRLTDIYQTGDFIGTYLNSKINTAKRKSFYDVLQDKGKYIEELQNLVIEAEKETASATIFNYLDNDSNKLIKDCCNNYIERVKSILRELDTTTENPDTTKKEPQRQQNTTQVMPIPKKLKSWLKKAEKAEFCKRLENGRYEWIGKNVDCAYFIATASDKLGVNEKQLENGEKAVNWQYFVPILNIDPKKMREAHKQNKNKGGKPHNSNMIDNLF